MVKFSKVLKAQLIPEWKEAFVNYWQLKKYIKRIRLSRKPKQSDTYGSSILDRVRCLAKAASSSKFRMRSSRSDSSSSKQHDGDIGDHGADDTETELVQLFSEEDEVKRFLERLDEEMEKVNQFYKSKEMEFGDRGEALTKQLHILLQLKQVINCHRGRLPAPPSAGSPEYMISWSCTSPCRPNGGEGDLQDPAPTTCASEKELLAVLQNNGGANNVVVGSMAPAKVHAKMQSNYKKINEVSVPTRNNDARSTTSVAAMSCLWEDLLIKTSSSGGGNYTVKDGVGPDLLINRKKVQCAEKLIRGAFVELYRGLGLLNTYRSLNMVAMTKILKKFDKVANRQMSADYLKRFKETHFIISDKVMRLRDELETTFTKHFTDNDRKTAMRFLRPQQQKDSHTITFFVGLLTGCFVTLLFLYATLAHLCGMLSPRGPADYMETVYPVFSVFALVNLNLFMYGCNLLMWKATRINYIFIFEFSPKTALRSRDVFLVCASLMTAVVGAMLLHLILKYNGFSPSQVDALPGILFLICVVLLLCPFNILYQPTRYFFIRVIRNIVCSPFYKVVMMDFFMGDQLTSQIPLLRHMETTVCYLLSITLKSHQYQACKSGTAYRQLAYLISFAPYYWRAMQCARRWFDESDPNQLANLGKYVSAMVAAGARLAYAQNPTQYLWMIIVLLTSLVATVYQLYWDFVKDWGLLNPNSKNPWLRDDLILRNKCIYYISIVVNVILRVAWVETVLRFKIGTFESRLLELSLASLEVIRRGQWNFYRLENEHLNNVGKFRAVKMVPLPFPEMDSD